jgi:predicted nucleotidyltransferase
MPMRSYEEKRWAKVSFDLRDLIKEASAKFPIKAIYLFGSRRFKTLSLRSDIDIFFISKAYIKHSDLRDFIDEICIALDIFILENGRAISVVNESYIQFADDAETLAATRAIALWSEKDGPADDAEFSWVQEYAEHVDFTKTVLPNLNLVVSMERLKARLSMQGLPTDPIIGESEAEIANRLISTARVIAEFKISDFPGKGSARTSFVVSPQSEYDFQDLFWIAIKPWIGVAAREQIEVFYDGQRKRSDFSFMNSRFIVEMKFAKDEDDKREIVKTLKGLENFYRENANVHFILFIIYARKSAGIDRVSWESRYSTTSSEPHVILTVIEVG